MEPPKDLHSTGLRLLRCGWIALLLWQITWHGLAPEPIGNRSWILVLLTALPLVLFTMGIWNGDRRGQFWGMLLVMLYFIAGVTEAWSNADQRFAASVQILISLVFFCGLYLSSRRAE